MLSVLLLLALVATAVATRTTSPCDQLGLATSYDVVVVGTGVGGSVAARRLAEWNPNWNILLIERGSSYAQCVGCAFAGNSTSYINDPVSGVFINSTVQPPLNNQPILIKDTAVQGGGTSVNGMYHVRGDAVRLFDDYFPPNWTPFSMIKFYQRYENYTFPAGFHKPGWTYDGQHRGNSGPVAATQQGPFYGNTRFLDALRAVFPNMPIAYNTSINDGDMPGIGSSYPESTSVGTRRVSAYTAYIQSYKGSNLKAITGTFATKVLFDSTAAATGVQLVLTRDRATQLGLGNQTLVSCVVASNKVVVSSGVIGTPKLLKLSGIGNPAELSKFNIPVVSNSPGLGENLRDHITLETLIIPQNSSVKIPYATTINNYGWAFYNVADQPNVPNDFVYGHQALDPAYMAISVVGVNLKSAGTVKLASADPNATPLFNPNYFGNPVDKYAVGLAAMKCFNVTKAMGFKQLVDPCATFPCQTPLQTVQAYINFNLIYPGYHLSATAALCNVTNPVSLRVQGTRGLYVLDASIMPYSPPSNMQATLYAVSERGIDQINANMHSTYELQDIEEAAGWYICKAAPNVAAIQ